MAERDTDLDWSRIAKTDPYFGVLSDPRFLARNIDDEARRAFFKSGQDYVGDTWRRLRPFIRTEPQTALDFGCGVGRLVLPIARLCERVSAIDVAPEMRALTAQNATDAGLTNVSVYCSIEDVPASEQFDWINSYIVFQHIPPARGYRILDTLLRRLKQGGVFTLHFNVARYRSLLPASTNRILLYRDEGDQLRPLHATSDTSEVRMAMFDYDLNVLLTALYLHGIDDLAVSHSVLEGQYGVLLIGRRDHSVRGATARLGGTLKFGAGVLPDLLVSGFAQPEEWGVWTIGQVATVDVPIVPNTALALVFRAFGYTRAGAEAQPVSVRIDGDLAAEWQVRRGEPSIFRIELPATARTMVRIEFAIGAPCSPTENGEGNDFRQLGLGLVDVTVEGT